MADKYLIGIYREFFDALGGDTIAKMMDDIVEESKTTSHVFQPPASKELLEFINEIMESYNEHRTLSHNWEK